MHHLWSKLVQQASGAGWLVEDQHASLVEHAPLVEN